MSFEFRHQPFRGIYLTYQLLTLLFRVPVWVLLSIPKSWRPRQSWPLKLCIWVKLLRLQFYINLRAGAGDVSPPHQAIRGGKWVKGVWVDPPNPQLISGELKKWASVTGIDSIRLPGYWLDKEGLNAPIGQTPESGEKVIYSLHGGGYIGFSAHPSDKIAAIPRSLLKHITPAKRAFSVEYRLSTAAPFQPSHPFPTALIDALAGYNYLVNTVGFSPSDIIIEGDSAGGNLALALVRYLTEHRDDPDGTIPAPPGAMILLSPWADLGGSHDKSELSTFKFTDSDFLNSFTTGPKSYTRIAFLGLHGGDIAKCNPYISPASLEIRPSFVGFPKTFICSGGAEILLDQIKTLRDRIEKDVSNDLTYYEAPDAIHDFLAFGCIRLEAEDALKAIGRWIN